MEERKESFMQLWCSNKTKEKILRIAIRLELLYGKKDYAIKRHHSQKMSVTKMHVHH